MKFGTLTQVDPKTIAIEHASNRPTFSTTFYVTVYVIIQSRSMNNWIK